MTRFSHLLSALRRRFAAEHGGFLIEVMVSAALIVTAGGGVLIAMDSATKQTGEQRLQALGADVAQAEMERLRAQKFDFLTTLNENRTVTSGGRTYTVANTSAWAMQAPAGAVQCNTSARSPEALRITTTVRWPNMARKPVVLSSLVAAPAGSAAQRGTYIVQVTDRNGGGLSGMSISMSGATPATGTTDANGCVRFTELQAGTYTVAFSRAGYVTPAGASSVSENVDVVAGQTRSNSWEMDRPGQANITFRHRYTTTSGQWQYPTVTAVLPEATVNHTNIVGGARLYNPTTSPFSTGNLYPFGSAYTAYAGDCVAAMPPTPLSLDITPAGVLNVNLQLPAMRVEPRDANQNDSIYVRDACGDVLGPWLLDSNERVHVGAPHGPVSVCVVDTTSPSNPPRWDTYNGGALVNDAYDDPKQVAHGSGRNFDLNSGSTNVNKCDGWLP